MIAPDLNTGIGMSRTWKQLDAVTGGLSSPGKMPCHGWSVPAARCKIGSMLRKVKGSTCQVCYALKGRYIFPVVKLALERRLDLFEKDPDEWIGYMAESIIKTRNHYFRWFDSGDLQGTAMLEAIVTVALLTPCVRHWLPTREYAVVRAYLKDQAFPENLIVRISAPMVDGPHVSIGDLPTSGVHKIAFPPPGVMVCPASENEGKCGECRSCWNVDTNVSYPIH